MKKAFAANLSLSVKFYLMIAFPLLLVSIAVGILTWSGLQKNARQLEHALEVQAKANKVHSLLQTQDEASKILLLDPNQLEVYSTRKIEAYDEHKKLLLQLKDDAKDEQVLNLVTKMLEFDEAKLRPLDSEILEVLFADAVKAKIMYFDKYEPNRKQYETWVIELEQNLSVRAQIARVETEQKNQTSILQICAALLLGVSVVVSVITVLSKRIEKSDANTKSLLAALSEGLMFFDRKGNIAHERSQATEKILPGSESLLTLHSFFANYCQTAATSVDTCLSLLWQDDQADAFFSDFESSVTFLPKQAAITVDGSTRTIQFEYRALNSRAGKLDKVIVVASDVTDRLKHQREALQQSERVRKISKAASNVEAYLSFLEEAIKLFRSADQLFAKTALSDAEDGQLKRDLHTIKGSVGVFEFSSIGAAVHQLETCLGESGFCDKAKVDWESIKDRWKFETSDIDQTLGLQILKGRIMVPKEKFERFIDHARASNDRILGNLLADAVRYPVSQIFSKYADYLLKMSERSNGDKQVAMSFVADSSEVGSEEVQGLNGILLHIFRNCFDHGIEPATERQAMHKPAAGIVSVAIYRKKSGDLHLVVKDDGGGIPVEKLVSKAVSRGIWTPERAAKASPQEKIDLIFAPNLSTKEQLSETSGRGVGMDAVRQMLTEMDGRISVYTEAGVGTQFEIDVPALAMTTKIGSSAAA